MIDELAERRKRKQIIAFITDEMQRSIPCTWIEEEIPQKAIDILKDKKI